MDWTECKVGLPGSGPDIPPSPNIKIRHEGKDGDYIPINSGDDVQMAFGVSDELV